MNLTVYKVTAVTDHSHRPLNDDLHRSIIGRTVVFDGSPKCGRPLMLWNAAGDKVAVTSTVHSVITMPLEDGPKHIVTTANSIYHLEKVDDSPS